MNTHPVSTEIDRLFSRATDLRGAKVPWVSVEVEIRLKNITHHQFDDLWSILTPLLPPNSIIETKDVCKVFNNYRVVNGIPYEKTMVSWIDLCYFRIPMRFAVSTETRFSLALDPSGVRSPGGLLPRASQGDRVVERKRHRKTLDFGGGLCIMFTIVSQTDLRGSTPLGGRASGESASETDPGGRVKELYEIEIEFGEGPGWVDFWFASPPGWYILNYFFPHHILPHPTLVRPVNLERDDIPRLGELGFTISNKLDGVRFSLYILPDCIIAKSRGSCIFVSGEPTGLELNSLLHVDAELLDGVFYMFDCSHRNRLHSERMTFLQSLVLPPGLKCKVFDTDLHGGAIRLLTGQDSKNNDGLIFTSRDGWIVKKWKYPSKLTIDFRIKGGIPLVWDHVLAVEVPFGTLVGGSSVVQGGIYECSLVTPGSPGGTFIPQRARDDRKYPNKKVVAQAIYKDMLNPIGEQELIDGLCNRGIGTLYRAHHNSIKRDMINRYCKGVRVVDIGSGKGGDFDKYSKGGASFVYFIEPDEGFRNEFLKRRRRTHVPHELVALPFEQFVHPPGTINVVASFFSLTFFTERLDECISTIEKLLLPGGFFIGTVLDGSRTIEFLKDLPGMRAEIGTGGGYIRLTPGGVELLIPSSQTVNRVQTEGLIFFQALQEICVKKGLLCISWDHFSVPDEFSPIERALGGCYASFIFQKQ